MNVYGVQRNRKGDPLELAVAKFATLEVATEWCGSHSAAEKWVYLAPEGWNIPRLGVGDALEQIAAAIEGLTLIASSTSTSYRETAWQTKT